MSTGMTLMIDGRVGMFLDLEPHLCRKGPGRLAICLGHHPVPRWFLEKQEKKKAHMSFSQSARFFEVQVRF